MRPRGATACVPYGQDACRVPTSALDSLDDLAIALRGQATGFALAAEGNLREGSIGILDTERARGVRQLGRRATARLNCSRGVGRYHPRRALALREWRVLSLNRIVAKHQGASRARPQE